MLSTLTDYVTFGLVISGVKAGTTGNAVCGRFSVSDSEDDRELFRMNATSSMFAIRILKMRLSGCNDSWTDAQKVTTFKSWLQSNPVTFLYQLNAPQSII